MELLFSVLEKNGAVACRMLFKFFSSGLVDEFGPGSTFDFFFF